MLIAIVNSIVHALFMQLLPIVLHQNYENNRGGKLKKSKLLADTFGNTISAAHLM